MRKYFLIMACAMLVITLATQAQKDDNNKEKPRIEGSGNVITKDVTVSSFDALNVSGVFNVLLTQGNKESVKIEADDNLQDLFEVKNEGSTLTIGMKKDVNFNSKTKMKVYVTFKSLKSMDLKTVGNISSDNDLKFGDLKINNKSVGSVDLKMTAQNLDIDNKSVGNVKLGGKADNAVIKNKGVGSMQAADFVVQKMNIENNGVGNAEVNAERELVIKDSFLGKVNNKGKATARRIKKVVI
jgi:Putative auto-transporter adhesin, head GIN domain